MWDVDGNKFLDFKNPSLTGYCHPAIIEAIKEQSERVLGVTSESCIGSTIELAEKLAEITPGAKNKRVFFTSIPLNKVMELVRKRTKRPYVGIFSMLSTSSKFLSDSHKNVFYLPYPDCYNCVYKLTYPSCGLFCIKWIEEKIFKKQINPERVAGVIISPIFNGCKLLPKNYLLELKEILERYGLFLISDETEVGIGRTGRMFAIEHWNTKADFYCIKNPVGAVIARAGIMPHKIESTIGNCVPDPLTCASALATIKLLEDGLVENAEKMGSYLLEKLENITKEFDFLDNPRGKGLLVGVEIVQSKKSKKPWPEKRRKILAKMLQNGLLAGGAGISSIQFNPALIVDKKTINIAIKIFGDILVGM